MALKALSTIDSLSDMLDYVEAEYDEAVKYCSSTVVAEYAKALDLAQSYYKSYKDDSSMTASALDTITDRLTKARAAWKSAGCTKASGSTDPSADKEESGFVWTPYLLAGVGLLAVWYIMRK